MIGRADRSLDTRCQVNKAEIRRRAADFSREWSTASSEQSQRQSFWDAFYEIFGLIRRYVAVYEQAAEKLSTGGHGWIDMLQPGEMAVEHKSCGGDLEAAMEQLEDYLAHLKPANMPWLLVACDFGQFGRRVWGQDDQCVAAIVDRFVETVEETIDTSCAANRTVVDWQTF